MGAPYTGRGDTVSRIRFLRAYRIWGKGDVAELTHPIAELFVLRKIAEWVEPVPECATVEAPEKAVARRPRKRKARARERSGSKG